MKEERIDGTIVLEMVKKNKEIREKAIARVEVILQKLSKKELIKLLKDIIAIDMKIADNNHERVSNLLLDIENLCTK